MLNAPTIRSTIGCYEKSRFLTLLVTTPTFENQFSFGGNMTRPVGGGALDLTLVVEGGLVNQEHALSIVRDDPGASTAEYLETVLEPRDFWQRSSDELYDKLGLRQQSYKLIWISLHFTRREY